MVHAKRRSNMPNQPKLVKNQSQVQKQLNFKQENTGNAQFIMGLNNRVAKLDKRLDTLEKHMFHLLDQRIGYRELAITLVLAVLIFTSITLAIKELLPNSSNQDLEEHLLQVISQKTTGKSKDSKLLSWINSQRDTKPDKQQTYIWPLEKQTNHKKIQYSQHKHGIHISTQLGDPVVAIAAGTVLYSGNAISEYGNLILIQHKNNVISVYGNNYSNYAKEGKTVTRGELIAAAGETQGHTAKLYFEVRYKGKAEDPFLYFNQPH